MTRWLALLLIVIQCPLFASMTLHYSDPARRELMRIQAPSEIDWVHQEHDVIDPEVAGVTFYPCAEELMELVECTYHRTTSPTSNEQVEEVARHELPGGWLHVHPTSPGRALIEYWDGLEYSIRAIVPAEFGRFHVVYRAVRAPTLERRVAWCKALNGIVLFEGEGIAPPASDGWGMGLLSSF